MGLFYAACHMIRLWTGCTTDEAVQKIHRFVTGRAQYHFCDDTGFANEVWSNVRNIIGDKRFQKLLNLSNTAISFPLLTHGINGGLPYVAISVFYTDDNEKQVLESVLVNLVRGYLERYGYGTNISVKWRTRYDLRMPMLVIEYARTEEEKRILAICLKANQKKIVKQYTPVTDDTEDEDLNDESDIFGV